MVFIHYDDFSNGNFLRFPEDNRMEQYLIFLNSLSSKEIIYTVYSIEKKRLNGWIKNSIIIKFEKSFNIEIRSNEVMDLIRNYREDSSNLNKRYSGRVLKKYEERLSKEFENDNKKINRYKRKILSKHGEKLLDDYMKLEILKECINEDIMDGEFELDFIIQAPILKVLDEKYRFLAEEFCNKFNSKFPGIVAIVSN